MILEFRDLTDGEQDLVLRAPVLVCILIAGADGNIDRKEIKEAISVVSEKKVRSVLNGYFQVIAEDFEDKLKILIQSYPYESTQRNPLIIQELAELNTVWKKLGTEFSKALYETLKELATRVASSSGGMFGLRKIDQEEAKLIPLPMLKDPSGQ
jgi:hypothetical protein